MEGVLDLYQKPLDTDVPVEIVYTPKHGSWLTIAEIELSVLTRQCLYRRIPDIETLRRETKAWEKRRNSEAKQVD